jgi:peptidoglycan/xylan/chitin deacetylase (PgdA/CDA1 family)
MFHGIGDPPSTATAFEAQFWVDPNRFRQLMDCMADYDDYEITFDDGNRSDIDIVMPILQDRGLTAHFFVLADRLNNPRSLGPADLRAMADAGMMIGSHGLRHRTWSELNESELHDELAVSREVLSNAVGQEVTTASVPFGRYNRAVLRALRRHGYQRVYTSDGGRVSPNAWMVPRTSIVRDDGPEVLDRLLRPGALTAARQQARYCYKRLQASVAGSIV